MVEVYSTNVNKQEQADSIVNRLSEKFPTYKINFDLEDRDNILRIEGEGVSMHLSTIEDVLSSLGFTARILDDTPKIVLSESQMAFANLK